MAKRRPQSPGLIPPAERPEAESPTADAVRAGVRLLKFKDRTRVELVERLAAKFGDEAARAAVAKLEFAGLTGDRRVAEAHARSRLKGKLEAASLAKRTLVRRGVAGKVAREAVEAVAEGESDLDRAVALLRKSAARLAGIEDQAKARRRAFATLARRGFDESTAERAIETVLGAYRDDEGDADADV